MVPLQEEEFFGEEGPAAKGAGALETLSSTCKSWPHHTCFSDVQRSLETSSKNTGFADVSFFFCQIYYTISYT